MGAKIDTFGKWGGMANWPPGSAAYECQPINYCGTSISSILLREFFSLQKFGPHRSTHAHSYEEIARDACNSRAEQAYLAEIFVISFYIFLYIN